MTFPHGANDPWVSPAGAPPGYTPQGPGEGPLARRFNTLGTLSLVLALAELLWCCFRLLSSMLSGSLLGLQRGLFAGMPGAPGAPAAVMAAAEDFAAKIAIWEVLRTLPFAIASGLLVGIALRIRRGDRSALTSARTWIWAALGAIVISVALQVFVILPATLEYQRRIMTTTLAGLPTAGSGPAGDIKQIMDVTMLISAAVTLLVSTLFFAAWPITLWVWAGRLLRDTSPREG